ncbi:hypothetical protein DC043_15505, partial [Enterococcus faecalis]
VPRGDAPRPEGLPAEDGPRGAAAVDRGLARERANVHAALVRGVQAPRRDELELAQARHVAALPRRHRSSHAEVRTPPAEV